MESSGQITGWEVFTITLLTWFGPTLFDDPMEALTRLRHTTTVESYKTEFEVLSNQLKGLTETYKLSCFLSGLREDICLMVRMLNPSNLTTTFGMAKMQKENVAAFRRNNCPSSVSTWPIVTLPSN